MKSRCAPVVPSSEKRGNEADMDDFLSRCCIGPEASLRQVFWAIQGSTKQIALVVDSERRLLGIVTDGDSRRAILAGHDLAEKAETVMNPAFRTGRVGMSEEEMAAMFRETNVGHIPLVDEEGRICDVVWYKDFQNKRPEPLGVIAVVMAGGQGSRLMPLTQDTPKPLLQVGSRPIVEDILERLAQLGLRKAYLTTCHLKGHFVEHFKVSPAMGMEILFLEENRPLGTAGGLGLLRNPDKTLLVINGDILTRVNFSAMLSFHREHGADMTVAMRRYEMQVPFGVLETEDTRIMRLVEKPTYKLTVNAGIYLMEPRVHALIPKDEPCQMTDLINTAMGSAMKVMGFPIIEYWLDIGTKCDYLRAQADILDHNLGEGT